MPLPRNKSRLHLCQIVKELMHTSLTRPAMGQRGIRGDNQLAGWLLLGLTSERERDDMFCGPDRQASGSSFFRFLKMVEITVAYAYEFSFSVN